MLCRAIGYPLAIVTAWLGGEWVHRCDAHWAWYQVGPGANTDDALAAFVWVVATIVLVRLVRVVTR